MEHIPSQISYFTPVVADTVAVHANTSAEIHSTLQEYIIQVTQDFTPALICWCQTLHREEAMLLTPQSTLWMIQKVNQINSHQFSPETHQPNARFNFYTYDYYVRYIFGHRFICTKTIEVLHVISQCSGKFSLSAIDIWSPY